MKPLFCYKNLCLNFKISCISPPSNKLKEIRIKSHLKIISTLAQEKGYKGFTMG